METWEQAGSEQLLTFQAAAGIGRTGQREDSAARAAARNGVNQQLPHTGVSSDSVLMHVPCSARFSQLPPSTSSHASPGCCFAGTTIFLWQNSVGKILAASWLVSFFNHLVYGAHIFCLLQSGRTTALKHFQIAWVKGKMEQAQAIPSASPTAHAALLSWQQRQMPQGKGKILCNAEEKQHWGRFCRASCSVL